MRDFAIIEYDVATAQREISAAWHAYQQTEQRGLEFGRVCCEWRDKFKSKGGYGSKGKGLVQHLDELSIPRSTAYWWMARYEKPEKEEKTPALAQESREITEEEKYLTSLFNMPNVTVRFVGGERASYYEVKIKLNSIAAVQALAEVCK